MTIKALGQKNNRSHHTSASEANVGDLLDSYSDKLARLVEGKSVTGRGSLRTKKVRENGTGSVIGNGKDKEDTIDSSGTSSDPAGKG